MTHLDLKTLYLIVVITFMTSFAKKQVLTTPQKRLVFNNVLLGFHFLRKTYHVNLRGLSS